MLLIDYLHLIGLQRHHKGLLNEHQDQTVPQSSLELAFLVDKRKNRVQIHPDEDSDIGHDEEALKTRLDGQAKHLEGPTSHLTYNLSVA